GAGWAKQGRAGPLGAIKSHQPAAGIATEKRSDQSISLAQLQISVSVATQFSDQPAGIAIEISAAADPRQRDRGRTDLSAEHIERAKGRRTAEVNIIGQLAGTDSARGDVRSADRSGCDLR